MDFETYRKNYYYCSVIDPFGTEWVIYSPTPGGTK